MLCHQVFEGKTKNSNQERLKMCIFTIKIMSNEMKDKLKYFSSAAITKNIFSYFIKINKFLKKKFKKKVYLLGIYKII